MITAYEGNEPYIFVSYAHKDTAKVLPILEELQARGFRIWYDAGIEAGTEWPEYIAEHLRDSGCVLAFLSESALASINCRQEINLAINKSKPLLVAHLEACEMSIGMQMRLDMVQAIYRDRHPNDASFIDALDRALILQPCRRAAVPTPPAPQTAKVTVPVQQTVPVAVTAPVQKVAPVAVNENDPQVLYEKAEEYAQILKNEKAFECYCKAAEQGHVESMYEVALCYDVGVGVAQDYVQAAMWYEKVALQGHAKAQFELGRLYENGNGVKSDLEKAFFWYEKAAEQGLEKAQDKLGFSYCFGVGVEIDLEKAEYWWKKASENGSVTAGISLSTFFPK